MAAIFWGYALESLSQDGGGHKVLNSVSMWGWMSQPPIPSCSRICDFNTSHIWILCELEGKPPLKSIPPYSVFLMGQPVIETRFFKVSASRLYSNYWPSSLLFLSIDQCFKPRAPWVHMISNFRTPSVHILPILTTPSVHEILKSIVPVSLTYPSLPTWKYTPGFECLVSFILVWNFQKENWPWILVF